MNVFVRNEKNTTYIGTEYVGKSSKQIWATSVGNLQKTSQSKPYAKIRPICSN
jgi:hypothetical protein